MNIYEICGQCCKKQREKMGLTQKQVAEEYPRYNLNRIKYLEGGRCATYTDYALYMHILTDSSEMVQDFFNIMYDAGFCHHNFYIIDRQVINKIKQRIKEFCEKYALDVEVTV